MPSPIRHTVLGVSRLCGVQRLFHLTSLGPIVLFYHGVEEKIVDPYVQQLHLPLKSFERQMNFLRRHRGIISIDYLYECVVNHYRQDPRQVVLTFDDGYTNNASIVAPMLRAWNIPFTVFISTRHISEHRRFATYYVRAAVHYTKKRQVHLSSIDQTFDLTTLANRVAAECAINQRIKRAPQDAVDCITGECVSLLQQDEWAELNARFCSDEPMNWEDVHLIRSNGGTIGSHCHDHCVLHAKQREDVVFRQLELSKTVIEKNVGECRYFAYPNGTLEDISNFAYSAAKSAQFRMCFSTIEGEFTPEVDRHLAPRFWAVPDYEEFCYTLSQTGRQNRPYFETCRTMRGRESTFAGNYDIEDAVSKQ